MPPERYDHAVIALTEVGDFHRRITRDRVSFHALNKPPGHGLAVYRDLHRLFRQLKPSIVHTRNIAASEAQLPAALAGVPVRVHGEHGWEVQDVAGGKRSHHLQRRFLRPLIHRHVALSGEIRRYLEDRVGVPADDIAQICNGVDTVRFAPRVATTGSRRRSGPVAQRFPEDGLFVVGTVGRLSPVKHQALLVDAFARACAAAGAGTENWRLVIAGDGPDRAAIEARVAASGIADRVWMTGARDDVPALMTDLDLFVLPSLAEGISNTILEAMACGLPIVATRVGGNAELVDEGRTGSLVASDDAAALAHLLHAYATDPARVAREGVDARSRAVTRFSLDAMVSSYAAMYDALLDRRLPSTRRSSSRGPSGAAPRVVGSGPR